LWLMARNLGFMSLSFKFAMNIIAHYQVCRDEIGNVVLIVALCVRRCVCVCVCVCVCHF
jgi:hypothetical protein